MKLKIVFTLALLVTLLAGCSAVTDDDSEGMTSDQTLAYSTYMAGAFLSNQEDDTTAGTVTTLDAHTEDATTQFEAALGEVNHYFETFKVFIDNGMENPFDIEQDIDVDGDYDIAMRYSVEEKTFTILLNEDEEGTLDGTLILNDVEYDVEGTREVETETEEEDDGTTTESREDEIYIRTLSQEDSNDFVELSIETEDEHDEYEFEMALTSVINGVEKELEVEFSVESDEVEISIEDGDNAYAFSRETDDDEIDYAFEYTVDGTEGEVEMTVTTDDNGNEVYHYSIEESGETREFEKIQDDEENSTT